MGLGSGGRGSRELASGSALPAPKPIATFSQPECVGVNEASWPATHEGRLRQAQGIVRFALAEGRPGFCDRLKAQQLFSFTCT